MVHQSVVSAYLLKAVNNGINRLLRQLRTLFKKKNVLSVDVYYIVLSFNITIPSLKSKDKNKKHNEKAKTSMLNKTCPVWLFAVNASICPLGGAAPAAASQEGSQSSLGGAAVQAGALT